MSNDEPVDSKTKKMRTFCTSRFSTDNLDCMIGFKNGTVLNMEMSGDGIQLEDMPFRLFSVDTIHRVFCYGSP